MNKARIIKRTAPDGRIRYIIQQRHFLFRWWWVDAWVNHDVWTTDSFDSLEEAKENLCWFDGTEWADEVVETLP